MSLPYSTFVPVSSVVQTPAFGTEKKHMLLAMTSPLIPASVQALEFTGATQFGAYFGQTIPEYTAVQKYFSQLSKSGTAPDKVVVARWFNTETSAFYKGTKITNTIAELKTIGAGSFLITMDGEAFVVSLNLSDISTYSDIASLIKTQLNGNTSGGEAYTGANVVYSSITGGLIITSGTSGTSATLEPITEGGTGADYATPLGLINAEVSQGVNAETFTAFCDRIFNANTAGFAITTLETLTNEDMLSAITWLQQVQNGQSFNTRAKLVFNINDKTQAEALQTSAGNMTGFTVCYDPLGENINILDCAIGAAVDFTLPNSAINFNFQPANGYTPITELGTVVDYQSGQTNLGLWEELSSYNISCVYSVGFGNNKAVYYGKGLMTGDFGTEDVQLNESWLVQDIQVNVMNAFDMLNKVKLQGDDAIDVVSSLVSPSFEKGKQNGVVANNGTLSDTERLSIVQATGVAGAADTVANNGYFFKVQPLTTEDIAERRVRIVVCYLCGGVVNEVRIINNIYGA